MQLNCEVANFVGVPSKDVHKRTLVMTRAMGKVRGSSMGVGEGGAQPSALVWATLAGI